jgi:uncharacterized membrane protein YdjX (TVP38/TMEM64 family)
MKSRTNAHSADRDSDDAGGPRFVPLEETIQMHENVNDVTDGDNDATATRQAHLPASSEGSSIQQQIFEHLPFVAKLDAKKVISGMVFSLMFLFVWDALFAPPEYRILKPHFAQNFLTWVQANPAQGVVWMLIFLSVSVVFMVPIGTPLTLGCGYIYKGAYGWKIGVLIATVVSMAGSALGAVACFLMGRYLMRDTVRKWIRKYPLFDAIDVAAAEHGLRIMAMLYLTPILPLGPVSYMCGTTSMALSHFIIAKVAALPLMMLYVFIGASTGTLISKGKPGGEVMGDEQVKSIEENQTLIISGILLSFVTIACITHFIKKELNKILDRQKRQQKEASSESSNDADEATVELGKTSTAPRQRKQLN